MEEKQAEALLQALTCTFTLPKHLLNEPQCLPCGKSACKSCITRDPLKNHFKCEYCNQVHKLNNRFVI